ncbi:MAG: RNA polymerase sigma factor [Candidatus Geothermincolia bacterium]
MKVQGNRHGETKQFSIETVYEQFHSQVVRFFLSKGLQRDAAEDLGQEVFYRVLRSGKVLADEAYTRNLVFCIAQNLLIDHFRKNHGPVQERTGVEDDVAAVDNFAFACYDTPEETFVSDETSRDVREVLAQLPERHARALVLRELEGLSYKEMAQQMGMSEKAAESLLHRARVQLKSSLAEAGERRGGWWSMFPVSLAACKKAVVGRIAAAPKFIASKLAGITASVSSVGLGHSMVTFLLALILIGTAVGGGAVAAAYTHQGNLTPTVSEPRTAPDPGVTQLPNLPGLYVSEAQDNRGTNAPAAAETVTTIAPVVTTEAPGSVPGLVSGVLQETGSKLDLLTSDLGKYLTTLADPLLKIVGSIGLPQGVSDLLYDVVGLSMVRDLERAIVDTGVAAATGLESTLQSLIPTGLTNAVAAPGTAAAAPQTDATAVTQQNPSNVQQPTTATTTVPANNPPATQEPAVTTEPTTTEPQPAVTPPPVVQQPLEPVTGVVEEVVNLVDNLL